MSTVLDDPIVTTEPFVAPLDAPNPFAGLDFKNIFGGDNPEDCAHIVKRDGDKGAGQIVAEAIEAGTEVEALCGYRWIPVRQNPDELPICTSCAELVGKPLT